MPQPSVFYHPVKHGMSNMDGKRPIAYYGKTFRVPRSAHGTVQQLEWEMPPREVNAAVTTPDGEMLDPVDGALIERLEIVDRDTGDLWVMYRVPYPHAS